ncbi:MAG: hypothetical protein GYA36_20590 [Veillonellaceae bacterium]|nr:hypothetical protein [Veillonellaceae bacterium]
MVPDDFVDLEYIHDGLGLGEETKFDEVITNIILPYTYVTFSQLGITEDNLTQFTEQQLSLIRTAIAVNIGCFLVKKDPEFGQKYNIWKVGNVSKGFLRRNKTDIPHWCDYYTELLLYVSAELGISHAETAIRPGLNDEYSRPY